MERLVLLPHDEDGFEYQYRCVLHVSIGQDGEPDIGGAAWGKLVGIKPRSFSGKIIRLGLTWENVKKILATRCPSAVGTAAPSSPPVTEMADLSGVAEILRGMDDLKREAAEFGRRFDAMMESQESQLSDVQRQLSEIRRAWSENVVGGQVPLPGVNGTNGKPR